MLMYQPDFVVVDFSVNDDPDAFFQETYEGLIRKIMTWSSKPALLLLNNVFYDTGKNAQEYHDAVRDWYHLPNVSIRDTVWQRMKAGEFTREEITPDGLHPNDKGHGLVAAEIIACLEQVKTHLWEDVSGEHSAEDAICAAQGEIREIPPMTENAYENAAGLRSVKSARNFTDSVRIRARRRGIWIILRTAGSGSAQATGSYLKWRRPVSRCSTGRRSVILQEKQN